MLSEWINEYLIELMEGFLQGSWKWLDTFMLSPTSFSKQQEGVIGETQQWIMVSAVSLSTLFMIFALMKELTKRMGGYSNRSNSEILSKGVLSVMFAYTAPWMLLSVLLAIANAISGIFLSKNINVDTLKKLMDVSNDVSPALVITVFVLTITILIMMFQYIIRFGNLMVLWVLAPVASSSIVNEEMNIFPAFWREACALVFQQPFQLMILYFIVSLVGDGKDIEDYYLALGLMIVLILSPGWLRKFLYSTGSGKTMVNAAGSAGRMAMMRLIMKR
ncbi:conjugal transfer protein TrbL family protein [Bacillus sp. JJ634]